MIWWFLVTYFFDKLSKKYPMLISVLHTFSDKIILSPEKNLNYLENQKTISSGIYYKNFYIYAK